MRLPTAIDGLRVVFALSMCCGCGDAGSPHSEEEADEALSAFDPAAAQEIQQTLSQAINEASYRYTPLDYDYNEDLLERFDQIEALLADPSSPPARRFIVSFEGKPPKLDQSEELEHFRQTIHRWEAKTGRKLREAINPLKAEVAARKPGEPVLPEFHRRFSAVFDDLIELEVLEMRERRNRAIAQASEPIFAKYREKTPGLVDYFERMLRSQGFAEPDPRGDKAPGIVPPPAPDDGNG